MPWMRMEVREQRVEFVVRALRETEPMSRLCSEFGISRPTGYLWLERYREGGVHGCWSAQRRRECRTLASEAKQIGSLKLVQSFPRQALL